MNRQSALKAQLPDLIDRSCQVVFLRAQEKHMQMIHGTMVHGLSNVLESFISRQTLLPREGKQGRDGFLPLPSVDTAQQTSIRWRKPLLWRLQPKEQMRPSVQECNDWLVEVGPWSVIEGPLCADERDRHPLIQDIVALQSRLQLLQACSCHLLCNPTH